MCLIGPFAEVLDSLFPNHFLAWIFQEFCLLITESLTSYLPILQLLIYRSHGPATALRMALNSLDQDNIQELYHNSDRGSQY